MTRQKPLSVTTLVVMIYFTGFAAGWLTVSAASFAHTLLVAAMVLVAMYLLTEEVQRAIKAGPR